MNQSKFTSAIQVAIQDAARHELDELMIWRAARYATENMDQIYEDGSSDPEVDRLFADLERARDELLPGALG